MNEKIEKIIQRFALPKGSVEAAPYGNGISMIRCV